MSRWNHERRRNGTPTSDHIWILERAGDPGYYYGLASDFVMFTALAKAKQFVESNIKEPLMVQGCAVADILPMLLTGVRRGQLSGIVIDPTDDTGSNGDHVPAQALEYFGAEDRLISQAADDISYWKLATACG